MKKVWVLWICGVFFSCSKPPKQVQRVEPVFREAVVEDPEVKVIEKTFEKNFSGFVAKYYHYDSTRIDYLLEVKNGELKTRYFFDHERHLQEENHYDCQAMHGMQKRYYTNGVVKEELEMDHGVRHGLHNRYWPNGKIKASERWHRGNPTGPIRVYDSAGAFSHYANRREYKKLFLD